MKTYPKTQFIISSLSEARKIVFTAIRIKECFYQNNNYQIVAALQGNDNGRQIVFPRFCTEIIDDLWEQLPPHALYKKPNPKKTDQIVKIISEYINKNDLVTKKEYADAIEEAWRKVEKKFWQYMSEIFPDNQLVLNIKKINVHITHWGHIMAFGSKENNIIKPGEVFLRVDANINNLSRSLIFTIFWDELVRKYYSYNEQCAAVDFILTQTKLARLFPDYQRFQLHAGFFDQTYKKQIGVGNEEIIRLRGDDIIINSQPAVRKFSKEELILLQHLKENNGRICNIKEIAHAIWPKNYADKFSLWAINSLVYRLRNKLTKNKVDQKIIETIKGRGFRLNDF